MHIELGTLPALEQFLGDFKAALLLVRVLAGYTQPGFGGAQGEVGVGHLCAQQHQDVFIVGLGGEVAGIG
ncbi:hypothetical protein D3C72_1603340 [compost metagenome]